MDILLYSCLARRATFVTICRLFIQQDVGTIPKDYDATPLFCNGIFKDGNGK